MILLTTFVIAFTPLRKLIPGYPNSSTQRAIIRNAILVDSLEYELNLRDGYLQNLKSIIEGELPKTHQVQSDTSIRYADIKFTVSKEDSILRAQVEEEEKLNLSLNNKSSNTNEQIYNLQFFPPVKGMITNTFNPNENHNGTDIVASPNEVVKSVLDGTVTLVTWSPNTGNIIHIQHRHNLVSIYKHVAEILKKEGQKVKAGDAIAVFGNTGEYSSGPHLHFELWHNGKPVNPEDYIAF
ncbi:MAG: hypothetical protein A2265_11155 [Bacteroidetes bacterium RIFOXYA12_FULL_33_9]|nr:MAG: hypothetical protein A2265_11155 [Bacteroidetes bacterium RIFOXYA12_FULL_33_9]